jgi:hypothetical protein
MHDEKICFKKIFADITNDIGSAIVLSEIVRYYIEDLEFPVEKDGRYWITKTSEEWWESCRMHADEVTKALINLGLEGLIFSKFITIKSGSTKCVRLNMGTFLEVLKEAETRTKKSYNLFGE